MNIHPYGELYFYAFFVDPLRSNARIITPVKRSNLDAWIHSAMAFTSQKSFATIITKLKKALRNNLLTLSEAEAIKDLCSE